MYKTKLQELCQRRQWNLPDYRINKEGPDHNPRYTSVITVNGVEFQSPSPCRIAKEAQNSAAKLALDHFSPPNPSLSPQTSNSLPFSQPSPPQPSPPQPSFSQPSLPQPSPPQPSFSQPSLPHPSPPQPSFSQPSLPHPSPPQPSFSQPSLPHPSPPQPSFSQPSLPHPSPPQPSFSQPSLPQPSPPQPSFSQPSLPQPSFSLPQPSPPISTGSSAPGTSVDNSLPTRSVMQPKVQETFQGMQINRPISSVEDIMTAGNQKNDLSMQRLYKNQLQTFAQKRNLNLPVYSCEREGPPHASRFKCKVTIDGQTYESLEFFSTVKDAEHAAAKVALMSLSLVGAQEDDAGLYKNLLQELVQKEGFRLPVYSTNKFGVAHTPIFVSNVEIEGEIFTGQEAKSKKQAEMSAAKVAYTNLKERKGGSNQRSMTLLSAHQGKAPAVSSRSSESNVLTDLQQHANPKSPISYSPKLVTQNQSEKDKECSVVKSHHTAIPSSEPVKVKDGRNSSSSDITTGSVKDATLSHVQSSSLPDGENVVVDPSDMPSTAVSTSTRRKVIVYARNTNVEIAEGGTLLPISDETWVAYAYSE